MASTALTLKASQGAGALSEYLLATFGRDAFALIVDEGGTPALFAWPREFHNVHLESDGFLETYGSVTALPSVTEKGYLDIRLTVSSPGGHSSIPPVHTVEFSVPDLLAAILTPAFNPDHRPPRGSHCGTGGKPSSG